MRMRVHRAVLGFGVVLMLGACAGPPRVPPPSTDIDETGYREGVRILSSDDFEGRRPGTHGEEKTVAYLVEQFRKLGLKPGNGDSYLQQVPLIEILAGSDASLAVSGRGGTRTLAYAKDMVIWTKRAVPASQLQASGLVFAGYGIVAPEYAWNDYEGLDVRGKTVMVLVNDPGYATKDPKVFKGGAMTYYGRWAYKIEEATRHGASGVLLIHDTAAAAYGWDVVVNRWTGPQFDKATPDGGAERAAIEGWITNEAARAMFAQAGLDFGALIAAAAHSGFKPVAMDLKVDAQVSNTIRRFNSANVIAWLPGVRLKNQYVMYTAHWDHLGRDPDRPGDNVFHGAVDNASGVSGLLMLAQSFKRTLPPPDRSIVFLAVTCGEYGLLGSAYYVDNPIFPLRDTAGVINLNSLHIGGPTRDVSVFGYGNSELEDYLRAAALLQGRVTHADPKPERGYYYRSDQFSFAARGIPALYAQGGTDDSARGPKWGEALAEDFQAHRYRRPADKYSDDWDVRGALDDLWLFYTVGNRLANTKRFPHWYPDSEFRASRERNRGSEKP
jgi:Zn-dependent M28 family amino/carboxypeptidase